jgi:hypothetical protein
MRLTAEDVSIAFAAAARLAAPGEPIDFDEVADELNRRLEDNLLGRVTNLNRPAAEPAPDGGLIPGRCRVCGCTEINACVLERTDGYRALTCAWSDAERTLCTNPDCLAAAARGARAKDGAAA